MVCTYHAEYRVNFSIQDKNKRDGVGPWVGLLCTIQLQICRKTNRIPSHNLNHSLVKICPSKPPPSLVYRAYTPRFAPGSPTNSLHASSCKAGDRRRLGLTLELLTHKERYGINSRLAASRVTRAEHLFFWATLILERATHQCGSIRDVAGSRNVPGRTVQPKR